MTAVRAILMTSAAALCLPSVSNARSAENVQQDISKIIEISLTRAESKNEACKTSRRSVSEKCGQSYIYPVISDHPDFAIASKINDFIINLDQYKPDGFTRIESWAEVTLNKRNILSISYSRQSYGQNALADMSKHVCTNLDLASGQKIELYDILAPGYEQTIPKTINSLLKSKLKSKLPGYVHGILTKKNATWTIKANQPFKLNEQDLTLCFDQGELSREAIGPVAVSLPYYLLKELIDNEGPLAFALEHSPPALAAQQPVVAIAPPPPSTSQEKLRPTPSSAFVSNANDEARTGSTDHTCFKNNITHTISVVEYDESSPFICMVEYDKGTEQKILWRSRKTKSFCHENAEKLAGRYESQWGYTCGRSSTITDS